MRYENVLHTPWEATQRRESALFAVLAVAGAMAVGALVRIPLPFSPIPLTLQTVPVLLAAFTVGRTRAFAGILLYIALGLFGVPLFAAYGPTFGYLVAFAMTPYVATRFRNPATGILCATVAIWLFGATWLAVWLHCSPWQAVALGVLPFIPGDILKAVAAYRLLRWVQR